jgi:hypothetical protein
MIGVKNGLGGLFFTVSFHPHSYVYSSRPSNAVNLVSGLRV